MSFLFTCRWKLGSFLVFHCLKADNTWVQIFLQMFAFLYPENDLWRCSEVVTSFDISAAAINALIALHACHHMTRAVQSILAMNPVLFLFIYFFLAVL